MLLKQSTARNLPIVMVSSSDHISGKSGLSAGLTIYLSKDGATPAAITPTVTELDATNMPGVYNLALTTAHTGTLGAFVLQITATGADPTTDRHEVVADLPGASVSSVTGAVGSVTGNVGGSVASVTGSVGSVTGNIGGNVAGSVASVTAGVTVSTNNDKSGYSLSTSEHTAIGGDVWDAARSGHTTSGSFGQGVASVQGNVTGSVGSVTGNVGGNVVGSVASVTADVTVGAYATGEDPASLILATAANKLVTDINGRVQVQYGTGTGQISATSGIVDANAKEISGDSTAAANLAASAASIGRGTVGSSATTTSIPTSALTPSASVADEFAGRTIIFDADTTSTELRGQAATISASTSTGTLTVSALTTAPASGDSFSIL